MERPRYCEECKLYPRKCSGADCYYDHLEDAEAEQTENAQFQVIIAGSRSFNDYNLLAKYCDRMFAYRKPTAIISGGARGADALGEQYAEERGIPVKRFPAQWDKYGKRAGYLRNEEMLQAADGLVAAWDKQSKGTAHMIRIAREKGIPVRIICF